MKWEVYVEDSHHKHIKPRAAATGASVPSLHPRRHRTRTVSNSEFRVTAEFTLWGSIIEMLMGLSLKVDA